MEAVAESVEVNGWKLTRMAGTSVTGSPRLQAAEALLRFAESEKFRASAMLHDEAQHAVPPQLEALEENPGMQVSLRTGRMVTFAATESAAMEIALVSGLSSGQAHRILGQAETLVMDMPEVLESLTLGRIGGSHVQRILEHTQHIVPEPLPLPDRNADEATREEWEREMARRSAQARADRRDFGVDMLAVAPGKSPAQLRTRGRQVLEKYYGLSFTKRSRTALRDRRITVEEAADGMSWLTGYLPTASCQAIFSKLDSMARLLKADPDAAAHVQKAAREARGEGTPVQPADDPAERRSMDQLRADVFTDMMLNGPRGQGLESVAAEVFVAIPATMLPGTPGGPVGCDDTAVDGPPAGGVDGVPGIATAELEPGAPVPTLLGGGPIDQESAVRLMNAARTWWRLITDPVTGAVVEFGRERYRPTAAQRAALQFRDGSCTTPGCSGPLRTCEIDHTEEWQDGGGTDIANLHFGCHRCHRLKSLGLIEIEQRAGGTMLVTSLFGTRRVFYPAAPWASAGPREGVSGEPIHDDGREPPPKDPDARIPDVEPRPYHPSRPDGGDTGLADAADGPGDQATTEPPPRLRDTRAGRIEYRRYEALQLREWGRIQDVPDSSTEHPLRGRYAQSGAAKATRKRRLKRIVGGYGPPIIRHYDDGAETGPPASQAPPDPLQEPPY
ncbi:DUF222 domain-containing protein [Arthrobacter sp.]|uniref:HNH endonuclease signature motif containing protein n=1 Tax=Arthrobacter sp. TaxID=1667 RepID=UPI003A9496BF